LIWITVWLSACGEGDPKFGYEAANQPPISIAGVAQNVTTGSTVTLDGSASRDANGDPLTYRWSLTSKPTGSTASLAASSSAKPTFIADFPGTYVATLTVNDGKIDGTSSTVTVTASFYAAPVADPGVAQNVTTGSTVTLDGSASRDANGDPLTYRWSLTSKPTGSIAWLAQSTSAKPTFTADLPGTYVATLIVNDGKIDSTSSTVTVASSPPKVKGIGYVAPNGMTVTLTNFEQYDLGNGYIRYTATYLQENKTSLSIDEGSLKLYFKNADPEEQYASFGQIQPGPRFTLERRYSWEVPSSSDPMLLQYKSKFFSESVAGSLHWIFPIK